MTNLSAYNFNHFDVHTVNIGNDNELVIHFTDRYGDQLTLHLLRDAASRLHELLGQLLET